MKQGNMATNTTIQVPNIKEIGQPFLIRKITILMQAVAIATSAAKTMKRIKIPHESDDTKSILFSSLYKKCRNSLKPDCFGYRLKFAYILFISYINISVNISGSLKGI